MTTSGRHLAVAAAGIALAGIFVLFSLNSRGVRSRSTDPVFPLSDARLPIISIDSPVEAYALWKQRRLRGRLVLSLGKRLNFVSDRIDRIPYQLTQPLHTIHPQRAIEDRLDARNFLLVSMEAGIARRVIHVLPEEVFRDKLRYARGDEGVVAGQDMIMSPYFGSPRTITTLAHLGTISEPVLLYINASVFLDQEPEAVYAGLRRAGVTSDLVVFCRSSDDSEVTDRERRKLLLFDQLVRPSDAVLSR